VTLRVALVSEQRVSGQVSGHAALVAVQKIGHVGSAQGSAECVAQAMKVCAVWMAHVLERPWGMRYVQENVQLVDERPGSEQHEQRENGLLESVRRGDEQ